MSCTIQIGNTTSKSNCLTKQYTLGNEIECEVFGEINIESPAFLLKTNKIDSTSNYLYCPTFNRYYHIVSIDQTAGERVVISCAVDVLETYKDQIKELEAYVIREESASFSNLTDTELPTTANDEVVVINFPNSIRRADQDDRNYLLITAN